MDRTGNGYQDSSHLANTMTQYALLPIIFNNYINLRA